MKKAILALGQKAAIQTSKAVETVLPLSRNYSANTKNRIRKFSPTRVTKVNIVHTDDKGKYRTHKVRGFRGGRLF
jgi:hypothetical protein